MKRLAHVLALLVVLAAQSCSTSSGSSEPDIVDAEDVTITWDQITPPDCCVDTGTQDSARDQGIDEETPPECEQDADCRIVFPTLGQCERVRCEPDTKTCTKFDAPEETPCNDRNPCTTLDYCTSGSCEGSANVCECETNEDCEAADDEDLCNGQLFCNTAVLPYVCATDPETVIECDATNDTTCMRNQCVPETGRCRMQPVNEGSLCNDNDPCTSGTRCDAEGQCVGVEECQCREDEDCLPFEDENLCNGTLYCNTAQVPFLCQMRPGSTVICSPTNDTQCRRNRCVPATGSCVLQDLPDDTPCSDENGCTLADTCQGGVCQGGTINTCNDDNPCTNDGCNPTTGECINAPNTASCDSQWACTTGDYCDEGQCRKGSVRSCDDGDPCTQDSCVEPDGCQYTSVACDDEDPCTDDTCVPMEGCTFTPVDCDDGDPCTEDSCDTFDGCVHAYNPTACPPTDVAEPTADVPSATDTASDVTPPQDITLDTWVDPYPPTASAMFRLDTLAWVSPLLCDPNLPAVQCGDVTAVFNGELADALADAPPLTLVEQFVPLDLDAVDGTMTFGHGSCTPEELQTPGAVCAIDDPSPHTAFSPVGFSRDTSCLADPLVSAPCFATPPADLSIQVFGGSLPLLQAQVYGSFAAEFANVTDGHIRGFVTDAAATALLVALPGLLADDLAELLTDAPTTTLGADTGWWITLSYHAYPTAQP